MVGPLDGVRVLDLSWILSGPYCTMILGDMGADVIKVERPGVGDGARGTGPFLTRPDGVQESAYFGSLNRNKRAITIDLSHPEGSELFLRLASQADVIVENFTPGTMDKFGLGYLKLSKRNPRIIYCSISGFGQTGPYAHRPALDIVVQAMSGLMSITGEPGRPPVRVGTSIGDITAGLFATIGICAALRERERSGLGQMLDISMLDCQVAILENAFGRLFATGEVAGPLGTRHPAATPFQAFPTKDGWLVVAIFGGNEAQWHLFCAAIGHPEWIDDDRFQTAWDRTQQIHVLEPAITNAMITRTTQEWLDELLPMGIPCGPVNNVREAEQDPQIRHRKMLITRKHQRTGEWTHVNSPINFSRTPRSIRLDPPGLSEHTGEILEQYLQLHPDEIARLTAERIV